MCSPWAFPRPGLLCPLFVWVRFPPSPVRVIIHTSDLRSVCLSTSRNDETRLSDATLLTLIWRGVRPACKDSTTPFPPPPKHCASATLSADGRTTQRSPTLCRLSFLLQVRSSHALLVVSAPANSDARPCGRWPAFSSYRALRGVIIQDAIVV